MQPDFPHKSSSIVSCKLIIFDLDGTLYNQRSLRLRVMFNLIFRLLTFRINRSELKILSCFRKQRESHKGFSSPDLENIQYQWCEEPTGKKATEIQRVIEKYMYEQPLKFIGKSIYPGVQQFMELLHKRGFHTAIYSDFPADKKLIALGITVDAVVSSTDQNISQLKPGNKAIEALCRQFNCLPGETLLIGDREDTDGESARMCGINFLKVDVALARNGLFYNSLINQFQS
jgi:FMN phosphatase YigB (HAD superfamily)